MATFDDEPVQVELTNSESLISTRFTSAGPTAEQIRFAKTVLWNIHVDAGLITDEWWEQSKDFLCAAAAKAEQAMSHAMDVDLRDTARVIYGALGPDERGATIWFDRNGNAWRSQYLSGSLWQHSDGGGPWQYGEPVAELAPYRETTDPRLRG